jgi:hypothetical protein
MISALPFVLRALARSSSRLPAGIVTGGLRFQSPWLLFQIGDIGVKESALTEEGFRVANEGLSL